MFSQLILGQEQHLFSRTLTFIFLFCCHCHPLAFSSSASQKQLAILKMTRRWQHWGKNRLARAKKNRRKEGGGGKNSKNWGQCWGEGWKGQNTVFISRHKTFNVPSYKPNRLSQLFENKNCSAGCRNAIQSFWLKPSLLGDSAALHSANRHLHHPRYHPWLTGNMENMKGRSRH